MADAMFTAEELAASVPPKVSEGKEFSLLLDLADLWAGAPRSVWRATFTWVGTGQALFTLDLGETRQVAFPSDLPIDGYAAWSSEDLLVTLAEGEYAGIRSVMITGGSPSPDGDDEAAMTPGASWLKLAETLSRAALDPDPTWPVLGA